MHRALSILAAVTLLFAAKPDPGRVTARRLNRYEYNNTIRDLLAIDFRPADDFPADDSGYGFDNIGDVLSLSPVLMEKYLHAAERIARTAIGINALPNPTLETHSRRDNRVDGPGLTVSHSFPVEGDYKILIALSGRPDPLKLSLSLDGQRAQTLPVEDALEHRRAAEVPIHVSPGDHLLAAGLVPDGPPTADPLQRNPYIGYLHVRGPYNPVASLPSECYRRVFRCGHTPGNHTLECARTNLADLARRAYRRPVTSQEVDGLMRFVESAQQQSDGLERGMQIALEAILMSPRFLFRIERDPNLASPATHEIDQFELATRLSYFLWSSAPDDELFQLAAEHRLRKPAVFHAQIRRMLSDPKSNALFENFGGQWLEIRNLGSIHPDPEKFPMFNDELRQAMQQETRLFFYSIIREDRSILDFIDANYTFLNQRLANFYGIPGVEGNQFRRVELPPGSHRGGILAQASVLTVSSYAARTSPVLRGKWVLENILNAPPPPPPPNVANLGEKAIGSSASARQQMEQHRSNPACRSCHARMDPLGFGLENYDAIGRWRTYDGNFPIDATGTLPGGKTFDGPDGLKALLMQDKNAFAECLTGKLLTYALGRGLEIQDQPTVQSIVRRVAAGDYKFSRLIEEIVASAPFQKRHGEEITQ
jgi:hypothetical protein